MRRESWIYMLDDWDRLASEEGDFGMTENDIKRRTARNDTWTVKVHLNSKLTAERLYDMLDQVLLDGDRPTWLELRKYLKEVEVQNG